MATAQPTTRTHVRWMIKRDLPGVLAIEQAVAMVMTDSSISPWSEEDFHRHLRQHSTIGMVAEDGDWIVGFMVYELHHEHIHVINFAVPPAFQRTGVGRQMMGKLIGKLSSQQRNRIAIHCRETNLAAQLFFRACGFKAERVVREYFPDTREDAYLMGYRLA